jgi:hypothetical protein
LPAATWCAVSDLVVTAIWQGRLAAKGILAWLGLA